MPSTDQHVGEGGLGYSYQSDFGMIGIGAKHFETDYGVTGDPPNVNWETIPPTTSRISQQRNTVELRSLFNTLGAVFEQVRVTGSYNDYNHSEFPTAQDSSGVSDPQANHFHKQEFNGVLQFQQHPWGPSRGRSDFGLTSRISRSRGSSRWAEFVHDGSRRDAYEELRATTHTSLQAGVRYDYNHIQTRPYAQSQDSTFQTIHTARSSDAVTASIGVVQELGAGLTATLNLADRFVHHRAGVVRERTGCLERHLLDRYSKLGSESGYGIDPSLRGTYNRVEFEVSPYLNYINNSSSVISLATLSMRSRFDSSPPPTPAYGAMKPLSPWSRWIGSRSWAARITSTPKTSTRTCRCRSSRRSAAFCAPHIRTRPTWG